MFVRICRCVCVWITKCKPMRYYISDLHFFHENMNTRMDCRGFANVEAMHAYIIERWNNKVRKNDEVMILGDLSYGKAEETNQLLEQLHGRLFLIKGNHDYFLSDRKFNTGRFQWIESYKEVKDDGRKVILSHYPIICYNGQFRKNKKGQPKTYMLYGHVHNTFDEVLVNHFQNEIRASKRQLLETEEVVNSPCQMINCFCMFSDYTPLTLDEWIVVDERRRKSLPALDSI